MERIEWIIMRLNGFIQAELINPFSAIRYLSTAAAPASDTAVGCLNIMLDYLL